MHCLASPSSCCRLVAVDATRAIFLMLLLLVATPYAVVQGVSENLTYSGYANVVVSGNEISNLDDFAGGHVWVAPANPGTTMDRVWMRNLVVTGNVVNSAVNQSGPPALFYFEGGIEGLVVANNVINNNGAVGPRAIVVGRNVTGLRCAGNIASIAGRSEGCQPTSCCL